MQTEGYCTRHSSETPRNLVVCIDGTSNKFGRKNTNVVKLYRQIKLDTEKESETRQHAYYSSGIGTHAKNLPLLHRVEKAISDLFDMALAWNVEENVKDAYGWLARQYQEGDKIYLFGFSRGAYQVRVLASLIHEVGLIRTPTEKQIEMAFGHYRSIHPHKPETREMATEFKRTYCWPGVRIHFVGVWDTVSSVGLIKGDVFVSTSASVTNASHFRHALALDERRVMFMPEYFQEMNAHRNIMLRPNADCDIKEVWFSGSHADVGGVSRLGQPYHAGNVSLLWMQSEASKQGLRLQSSNLAWDVEDVRSGRSDSLKFGWMLLEIMFPFRYQVSFSGAGKNKLKWHWFRPRRIIPGQLIHDSVWYGDMYRPRATLGSGIGIPTALGHDRPWEAEASDETMSIDSTELLAWIHRYASYELGALLRSRLDNATLQDTADWSSHIEEQADFDKFIAITTYILTYNLSTEDASGTGIYGLVCTARQCLQPILAIFGHPDLVRALSLLPHLAKNEILRREIIVAASHGGGVASALVRFLESPAKDPGKDTLILVVDSICYLLQTKEAELRAAMISQLTAEHASASGKTSGLATLSGMLETNEPRLTVASLRIIILLARDQKELECPTEDYMWEAHPLLKSKVQKLAKQASGFVGLMAVAAFEVLRERDEHAHDLRFSNILAFFGSSLWLDVEGGSKDSSLANSGDRPPLAINDSQIDERIMRKIVSAVGSRNASKRTSATLTFVKLCRYPGVRAQLLNQATLDKFIRQLRRKDTALLAAYTLKACLQYQMSGSEDFAVDEILHNIAPPIVTMLKNGLFDDSVGLVEGFEIFRQLMEHAKLRRAVENVENGIFTVFNKRLEVHEHDGIRTSLRCLDILEEQGGSAGHAEPPDSDSTSLVKHLVKHNLERLKNEPWEVQKKCVHILSALSQMAAGEEIIRSHVNEIVGLLLPECYWKDKDTQVSPALESSEKLSVSSNNPTSNSRPDLEIRPVPPSQMLGPSYALYSLSRNESLRNEIRKSKLYATLKGRYLSGSLVSGPDTPLWRVRTPNKSDVLVMIARMIKIVDEGFSYDGIGSVPETIPVVIQHLSGLGVLLRNGVVHALKFLPGLAVGFIHGTTIVISRGANKFRRGTGRQDTAEHSRAVEHRGPSVSLDVPIPPISPINDQPPVSQSAHSENDQEHIDFSRNRTQETGPSLIASGSHDPHFLSPRNSVEQITEVPLQEEAAVVTPRPTRVRTEPTHSQARSATVMHVSGPSTTHLEYITSPAVGQARETQPQLSHAPHRPPSGSITLKDFTVCDLPTKKYLKLLHPRARIRIRIGNQTFFSPTVKLGNQSAGGTRSRTHWTWNFSQPVPPNDEQIDIMVERRFLLGYTCIRHIAPMTVQSIREGYNGSGLPLLEGPPSRG